MASVKVAVRVRPLNQRERDLDAQCIIEMNDKKTKITNSKVPDGSVGRERDKEFTFDYSYWSYDNNDFNYISQEKVFEDLGVDVVENAFQGYNACVFAYGQTGSGKTYTMMGFPEDPGLIPRICKSLFSRMQTGKQAGTTYRTEVSYLEIYNERVKDLLKRHSTHNLKVREHPKLGPYVQDLSSHLVMDYSDVQELMNRGNNIRTTASTNMNDTSSRSHAIFTLNFVQANLHGDMPSETVSKVHLVDLAGSERADATGATGKRLKEGGHINKSLVTLGSVISALADKKHNFIPYRDSTLTWLLKDSLGGNSKTMMVAAISPADTNYGETLSTLRYANRAKNIINKPTINEDPNVKLIKELRAEIMKLRTKLYGDEVLDTGCNPKMLERLHNVEAREKVLTEEWTERWKETRRILQETRALRLRKSAQGHGVTLDSDRPHLLGIDEDLLSTGITLYDLKDGDTLIGCGGEACKPDIVLGGAEILAAHCVITLKDGVATLQPKQSAACWLNQRRIEKPTRLSQGCILVLGESNMFRYNDPAEVAKLKREGSRSHLNLSRLSLMSRSSTDLTSSAYRSGDSSTVSTPSQDLTSDQSEGGFRKAPDFATNFQKKRMNAYDNNRSGNINGSLDVSEIKQNMTLDLKSDMDGAEADTPGTCSNLDSFYTAPSCSSEFADLSEMSATAKSYEPRTSTPDIVEEIAAIPVMGDANKDSGIIATASNSSGLSSTPSSDILCGDTTVTKKRTNDHDAMEENPIKVAFREDEQPRELNWEDLELEERLQLFVEEEVDRRLHREQTRLQEESRKQLEQQITKLNEEYQHLRRQLDGRSTSVCESDNENAKAADSFGDSAQCLCQSTPNLSTFTSPTTVQGGVIRFSIPRYVFVTPLTGGDPHYEFVIKVRAGNDTWQLTRRYKRFRDLHLRLQNHYGRSVSSIFFPPRKLFGGRSERVVSERQQQLEVYLNTLVRVCSELQHCPLYPVRDAPTKDALLAFSPFFMPDTCQQQQFPEATTT